MGRGQFTQEMDRGRFPSPASQEDKFLLREVHKGQQVDFFRPGATHVGTTKLREEQRNSEGPDSALEVEIA